MRRALIPTLAFVLVALVPAGQAAAPVATTGGATFVTQTTATLNGTVDATYPDSAWTFQYSQAGATTLKTTGVHAIGTGPHAVSARVTGLSPGTTYDFQLVVEQDYGGGVSYSGGGFLSFKTRGTAPATPGSQTANRGRTSLVSGTVRIGHGVAGVALRCNGSSGAGCAGRLTIATTSASGKVVRCGGARFSLKAPHRGTVRLHPGGACLALVRAAPHHRIAAVLVATFTTGQSELARKVTLAG